MNIKLLSNGEFSDSTIFQAMQDVESVKSQMMITVFGCLESIVGKEENAGYQHVLLFPIMLSNATFLEVV